MRTADRNRLFTAHAQDLLDRRQHPVRMVAMERLDRRAMTAMARGGPGIPGRNVFRGSQFNREVAEAATGETMTILEREAAKRNVPVVQVTPRDISRICSRCGNLTDEPRKNQVRFRCPACRWFGNVDANACVVLAFRAYQQQVDPTAVLGPPPTGGPEQPSRQTQPRSRSQADGTKARDSTPEAAARGFGQGAEQWGGCRGQPRSPRR